MKTVVTVVRFIVGILFIVSGLVKANDPLGLSYKMQEFFEIWNSGLASSGFFLKTALIGLFDFLHHHSLGLSVFMITLEIMAGVALLLGWMKNFVLNLLLILIVFFTFLTAYAFLSGKFKNCGCFGDCIPITPFSSFMKDVVLLVLIGFLLFQRKYIQPAFTPAIRNGLLATFLLLSVGLQWYVLNYLPLVDCLPFKEDKNIAQQMKIPEGAIQDSFAIRFVYQKEGRQYEFSPEQLPADLDSYEFVDRVDKMIRKGNAEPPIKGFALTGITGSDSTDVVLNQPVCLLLFCERFQEDVDNWMEDFKQVYARAQSRKVPVYVATSVSLPVAAEVFARHGLPQVQLFALDFTAIRTAARTNPTLYLLKKGTIQEKYSFKELDKAENRLQK